MTETTTKIVPENKKMVKAREKNQSRQAQANAEAEKLIQHLESAGFGPDTRKKIILAAIRIARAKTGDGNERAD